MLKTLLFSLFGKVPFVIDEIKEDHIEVNIAFRKLYGMQIVSNVERVKTCTEDSVKKLLSVASRDYNKIVYQIVRREKVDEMYINSLYYFSYNLEMLKVLTDIFGRMNVRFLKGYEIANVLYNTISLTKSIKLDKLTGEIKHYMNYFKKENEGEIVRDYFTKLMSEINDDEYSVYVASSYQGGISNIDKLFSIDWTGSLITTFDFNDQTLNIARKKEQATRMREQFKEMENNVKNGTTSYIGISSTLLSKEATDEIAIDLFYSIGFLPIKKKYEKAAYVYSPLYIRDNDYTFLVEPLDISKYLFYSFEKSVHPQIAEIFGRNKNGSFVAYSFFEENNNPHAMIFAPSGAGKSFSVQNIITNILRIDVSKLFEGDLFKKRENVRIRHFDKGFSAELLYKLLKERNFNVSTFNANIDDIKLNPCEIKDTSTDELEFSLYVLNTCVEAIGLDPLRGFEANWYLRLLKEVGTNREMRSINRDAISTLATKYELQEIYEKVRRLGYSDRDEIGTVSLKHEEFKFLDTPLIYDIIRLIGTYSQSLSLTTVEKDALKSLESKLRALADYPTLTSPTQIDLVNAKIMYIDYEFIANSKFFVPILLAILKRLTYADKFYKSENEYAYYVIDEAHNMMRNEYFNLALKILIKEARKYRISLMFLTQNFQDIAPDIILNADTIMFISPQEEERRRVYLQSYYYHMSKGQQDADKGNIQNDVEYVYMNTPPYTFTVQYSRGVFSLRLEVDKYKLQLFDSYRRELVLPDGKVIKKSLVMGEV